MKTVQEWLRKGNAEAMIDRYLMEYPIDFPMLENKERTVAEITEEVRENLRSLIHFLRSMKAVPTDRKIFFAVRARDGQHSKVKATLAHKDDLLKDDLPEHYAWDVTEWEQVLGYPVAETKLATDHIETVLTQVLHEMTFFGSDYPTWHQRKAEVEESLREAQRESENGVFYTTEEVFGKYGLPKDEPDEIADELSRKVVAAENEYNLYFRCREAARVREMLST